MTPAVPDPTVEALSEAERRALDKAATGASYEPTWLYETVERILAARAAAPDALRVAVEALAASIEALTGRSSDYDDAIDDVLDLVRALLEDGAQ